MPNVERATDLDDIAVVEAFLDAFQALDVDRALSLLADDIVYQNVPFPPDRGKTAVTKTLRMFGRWMTGFEVRMRNIAARNGVVLTERVDAARPCRVEDTVSPSYLLSGRPMPPSRAISRRADSARPI